MWLWRLPPGGRKEGGRKGGEGGREGGRKVSSKKGGSNSMISKRFEPYHLNKGVQPWQHWIDENCSSKVKCLVCITHVLCTASLEMHYMPQGKWLLARLCTDYSYGTCGGTIELGISLI